MSETVNLALQRRYARGDAYHKLPVEDRLSIDAMVKRMGETIPRAGPDTALEIIAAIGEWLAQGGAGE